ncbi:hypothetical protein MT325_m045L [Paramecium bursaria chlorella virus MT325]|uniref:Uncharacterized protein m045L n=1 Tax=Paramecium bursaria Chlorella virus MT325 TaxID=346932 RepID=A7ITC5_PBCVM|nr:hypothetical protein MT325_m045L [Paramecium bursaria chlorella virus MT325]
MMLAETLEASTFPVDVTFPMMFIFWLPVTIVLVTPNPFPMKKFAIAFPVIMTCPETSAFPLTLKTLAETFEASTLPVANTLPTILMLRVPVSVATTPVN